jgi:glyoxylase-like metal-dependent hydrolase (beta-lactamase superfamily II)
MAEILDLRAREVGPWPMNAYGIVCPATGRSALVDPGADPDILSEMLADTQPVAILLTHTHFDHVEALDEMRSQLGVPVLAHPGPHDPDFEGHVDRTIADDELLTVGENTLRVRYAPGHAPDQVCFMLEDDGRVIVGDTVFEGGPGKTWSPDGFRTTLATLRQVVLPWPDDTVCHPGHGPSFRLGDHRAAIEAFLAKDHGEFFGDATWGM